MLTSRFARACTCVAAAAAIGGCATAQTTSSTISGTKLTIYASVPSSAGDVLDAEKLAFQQSGGKVNKYQIVLKTLTADSIKQVADNARTADQDTTTIAYLGEVAPGASEQSVPITNQLGILEVSPTDNALELTTTSPVVSGSKNTFYPSRSTYGYTFGEIAPSSRLEASDLVTEMRSLGVTKLYVANDGSDYGRAIAHAVAADAGSSPSVTAGPPISAKVTAAGADAVFYGGGSASGAASFFNAVAAGAPKAKLFAPSALDSDAFASKLSLTAAPSVYVSGPGFLSGDLPAAGSTFEQSFKAAYPGQTPGPDAIFGFAAMKALLDALGRAGSAADDRTTVANDFFSLNLSESAVGQLKMTKDGDSNLTAIVFSHIRGGKLVPFKS
jgi:ABC-type branched-subunit amino acid transport system substrate-binding protein